MKITQDHQSVTAQAPTRIDIAGGTLDIWPLCAMLSPVVTINVATNLTVEAKAAWRNDGKFCIEALDVKEKVEADSFASLFKTDSLRLFSTLVARLCQMADGETGVELKRGMTVTTSSTVPMGSGLGGSSALAVSVAKAVGHLLQLNLSNEALLKIVQDIEAQTIGAPTGYQDYYPALYGGLAALRYEWGRVVRHEIVLKERVEDHFLLFYSGQAHQSAIPNWEMIKGIIDENLLEKPGRKRTFLESFKKINEATALCWRALEAGDWNLVSEGISAEWKVRKELYRGMVTPALALAMDVAMKNGAMAVKVCGAGGGGSFFALVDPKERERVVVEVISTGARQLPWQMR